MALTPEEEERIVKGFQDDAGPGEPFWRILVRDARAALARGDQDLAERLTEKAEQMKAIEERIRRRG